MKYLICILTGFIITSTISINSYAMEKGMKHGMGSDARWDTHMQNMDIDEDGKISRDEWDKYHQEKFDKADTNKDGFIDETEMQAFRQSMMGGMMHAKGKKIMWKTKLQNMDTDKDGKISRDEWDKYHEELFDKVDTDKDSFINKNEMQEHHQSMTSSMMHKEDHGALCKSHMQYMDADKDGKISRDEWDKYHQELFKKADNNKDDFIDKKELLAFQQTMMKKKKNTKK